MSKTVKQQILISGVGGQGVLFVTSLLAEAAINKRLHNRFGDKKSNLKVKTGKSIPFMIVFDKLPQNLDEYTIEVDGSSI